MSSVYEKIVVLTKKTPLVELIERLGTREQAQFYLRQEAARLEGSGLLAPDFEAYARADARYNTALEQLKAALPRGVRSQVVDSTFLPQFTFGPSDLIVALGPDGLVVNAAKYLSGGQPIVAVNPDPARIEGTLLPFTVPTAAAFLPRLVTTPGAGRLRRLTMAQATLSDGQTLVAVNDLFIGQRTHVSARYRLRVGICEEDQSSSGTIVSTGTGATGWLRSVVAGAVGIVAALGGDPAAACDEESYRFDPEAAGLRYSVREPWASKATGATLVHGELWAGDELQIVSQMPQNGVIFGDGVEADYLPFDSGAVARIGLAERRVGLMVAG